MAPFSASRIYAAQPHSLLSTSSSSSLKASIPPLHINSAHQQDNNNNDDDEAAVEFLTPIGNTLAPFRNPLSPPTTTMQPSSSSSSTAKRTDSTRTNLSSQNTHASSSDAAETDDLERSSLISSSAGGSSSLGRSASGASTTPTSPGLGMHRQEMGADTLDTYKSALTSRSLLDASSEGRRASDPQSASPAQPPATIPQAQQPPSLRGARPDSLPAITMSSSSSSSSSSAAVLTLRLTAASHSSTEQDDFHNAFLKPSAAAGTGLQAGLGTPSSTSASVGNSPIHLGWPPSPSHGGKSSSTSSSTSSSPSSASRRLSSIFMSSRSRKSSLGGAAGGGSGTRSPLSPANPDPHNRQIGTVDNSPAMATCASSPSPSPSPFVAGFSPNPRRASRMDQGQGGVDDYVMAIGPPSPSPSPSTSSRSRRPKTSPNLMTDAAHTTSTPPPFGSSEKGATRPPAGGAGGMSTSKSAPAGFAIVVPRLSLEMDLGVGLGFDLGGSGPKKSAAFSNEEQADADASSCSLGVKKVDSRSTISAPASPSSSTILAGRTGVLRSRSRRRSEKERLMQKPLPPGPPGAAGSVKSSNTAMARRVHSSSSRDSQLMGGTYSQSTLAVSNDSAREHAQLHPSSSSLMRSEDTQSANTLHTSASTASLVRGTGREEEEEDERARVGTDFSMERMIDTPVALLSPPLEDPRGEAEGSVGSAGGTVRVRGPANRPQSYLLHRRVQSTDGGGVEDYFGFAASGGGKTEGSIPASSSSSGKTKKKKKKQGEEGGAQSYDVATLRAGSLQRYSIRPPQVNESSSALLQAEGSRAGGLGVWHATNLNDSDDGLRSKGISTTSNSSSHPPSANSSRQDLPRKDSVSTTASASSSSGRMGTLGRRLSAVFDRRSGLTPLSTSTSTGRGSRSHASSAAPSEMGSPSAQFASLHPEGGYAHPPLAPSSVSSSTISSVSSPQTGLLLPPLEPMPGSGSGSVSSWSRPSSSIGFFRRFDRRGSAPPRSDGGQSKKSTKNKTKTTETTKVSLKKEAQLVVTLKHKKSMSSSQPPQLKSPSKIPVRTSSPTSQAVLETRSPSGSTKKAHGKTRSASGALAGATVVASSETGLAAIFGNNSDLSLGRVQGRTVSSQMSPSGSFHSRSPSVDALKSVGRRVDSPPLGAGAGAVRVQSRSSLALAEIEANIEAAAAKVTTSGGSLEASGWAKEVRALFVIREMIQTERSYAKHLEALIGAVRKTAALSSGGGGVDAGDGAGAAAGGTVSKRKGGSAGSMTYKTVSSGGKAASNSAGPAPHIVIMKTLLPPMIVLSRSLAARIEQNPTAAGVGAAFTLLQEQIEANFVSWSRAIGTIMDALRASESVVKGKSSKDRIGMIAPCPVVHNSSHHATGPFGSASGRMAPARSSSLDALALTRPSSPVGPQGPSGAEDDSDASSAAFPIWAVNPEAFSVPAKAKGPQRKRSSTISQLSSASSSAAAAAAAMAAVVVKDSQKSSRKRAESFKRSVSVLGVHSSSVDVAPTNKAARRLGATNDDLRLLDPSKWEAQTLEAPTKGSSPMTKSKTQTKKGSTSGSGGGVMGGPKMFEPQDLVIMPTQRVVRYILLMKDLLANTPVGGNAYPRVERALEVVTVVAEMCNKVARPMGAGPALGSTTPASGSPIVKSSAALSPGKTSSVTTNGAATPSPAAGGSKSVSSATPKAPSRRGSFVQTVQAMPRNLKKVAR
ncbi:hypothetical protein CF319_g4080 [Tilletia indica]|nr:hypothetical protein CF319_g4080 [Tilletia indica]